VFIAFIALPLIAALIAALARMESLVALDDSDDQRR
jgi:hypothetical protein